MLYNEFEEFARVSVLLFRYFISFPLVFRFHLNFYRLFVFIIDSFCSDVFVSVVCVWVGRWEGVLQRTCGEYRQGVVEIQFFCSHPVMFLITPDHFMHNPQMQVITVYTWGPNS